MSGKEGIKRSYVGLRVVISLILLLASLAGALALTFDLAMLCAIASVGTMVLLRRN